MKKTITPQERGELRMIPLDLLRVDKRYQRGLSKYKIKFLIENFRIKAVSVLTVSERSDGSLWVIDGQHRLEVLKALGYQEVQCLVHCGLTPQEEADLFTICNAKHGVYAYEMMRARLFAGEPKAWAIKETVEKTNFRLKLEEGNPPDDTISNIAVLERIYNRGGKEYLEKVLDIVRRVWPTGTDRFDQTVLFGLYTFIKHYPTYDENHLIKRLKAITLDDLQKIRKTLHDAAHGRGHRDVHFARAVLQEYNEGSPKVEFADSLMIKRPRRER